MNPNKALWEKGDFTRIEERMRESGEALIQRLGISNGFKVRDVGCGDGTTAIPCVNPMTWRIGSNVIERFAGAGVPADLRYGKI